MKTLLEVIKEKPNTSAGICGQDAVVWLSLEAFHLVRQTMVKWPKYSGEYDYPVPSTMEGCNARECFHNNLRNLWDRNTEYGALRWELLDWLIEQPELDVPLYKICRGGVPIMLGIKENTA